MIIRDLSEPDRIVSREDTENVKARMVELSSGAEIGEHVTDGKEEVIVFLEGSARVECEGEARDVIAPAAAYIGPEKSHNITNTGSERLRYVYVVAFLN